MIRFLVAIPLILHGLANLGGALAFAGKPPDGFKARPSIISPKLQMHSTIGRIWGVVWLLSALTLVSAGLAAIFQRDSWLILSILGSGLSFAAIAPWWNTVPPGARFGAIFDLVTLLILLSPVSAWLNTAILAT
ncbi:MAG: hypothetical protein A2W35_18955 [Chloroflexi bacterium RBG_16_57_11]|nr:MAG: hypothetical protein A2W35_18955 [Chloroflexi bacterium RBG_16_57_11]